MSAATMHQINTVGASAMTSLPRLAQETELQKMLADEKMRSEQHRTNYQTLKAEHTRLQDEYIQLQGELKSTIEDTKLVQEKYKNLLEQARADLATKQAECDELRSQALNPEKLDLLRIRVQEDVEKPFQDRFTQLGEETDKYRTESNKLKYEYSFLKAEYEHDKTESLRIIEEIRMRHEAEVCNLRKDREAVLSRSQSDVTDAQRLRGLQRENAQLHMKLKGLLSELEETRAQREHLGLQSDSVTRLQSKQLAEHSSNIKALETERNTLKLQLEGTVKELNNTQEMQTHFTSRIHDLEKENIILKNKAEEISHKSKVELTNLKMDMLKERGDLERQRDKLKNHIEDLKAKIELLNDTIAKQEECVSEKERECARRVQAAREQEWSKLHAIETEKLDVETKLQEIERRRIDEESKLLADRERMDERLSAAREAKESAEKEALVLKTKVSHQESLVSQLERERQENSDLKSRLHRIESTYSSYINSENELVDTNTRLRNEVEILKEDLRGAKEEIGRGRNETQRIMAQRGAEWTEERMTMQLKMDETQTHFIDLQQKLTVILEANKKKKKKISYIVSKLKNKVQVLNAKLEEACIERDSLRSNVSPEEHVTLKKKLNDLIRRHREFRNIILSEAFTPEQCREKQKLLIAAVSDVENLLQSSGDLKDVPIGDMHFGSMELAMHPEFYDLANQHEKELAAIKERLDQLDEFQRVQIKELKGVAPSDSSQHKQLTSDSSGWKTKPFDSGSDGHDMLSDDGLDTLPVKCS